MTPTQQGLLSILIAVSLAVVGFLLARHWQSDLAHYDRVVNSTDCDLRAGPCRIELLDGDVVLSIAPADIPLMQTLTLEVMTTLPRVDNVFVDIRGLNMDMGLNRTRLQSKEQGEWRGETILPICSQRRMEWEAAVQLAGSRPVEVPFPFSTSR